MKPAAKAGSRAVPMARPAISGGGGEDDERATAQPGRRGGSRSPRNRDAAGTVRARASGTSAKTAAMSRP